jgi:hypothetical protein
LVLRNEVLKVIKEMLFKSGHAVSVMAAPLVFDNFHTGIGRQQTGRVFVPKSRSEPFLASDELCRAQERSFSYYR